MTAPADRCYKCRRPLPGRDATHKRLCWDCAQREGPREPPVDRGRKPADHGERVRQGWRLRKLWQAAHGGEASCRSKID